jgi:hypothetical protein
MHTTNYFDTFIEAADDCPVSSAEIPPIKVDNQTIASIQFELIRTNPYKYTSDDVIFHAYAVKNDLTAQELEAEKNKFFSKGQACLRASPLTKRYGWGVHSDNNGKIAIYPLGSEEYSRLKNDPGLKQLKAIRSKRVK